MSSKGQIVIPSEMRHDLKEGGEFLILKDGDVIILKKADAVSDQMKEDIEFAKKTEEAWLQIERGESARMPAREFLKELKKW